LLANLAVFLLAAQTFKQHKRLRNSVFLIVAFTFLAASTFFYVPFAYGGVNIYYDSDLDAIIVYWDGLSGPSPFNLTDIDNEIADATLLNEVSPGVWWLNTSIEAWVNAEFQITDMDCIELRINSLPNVERQIRWRDSLIINNTAIYGWENGAYDTDISNQRAKFVSNITDNNSLTFYAFNTTFAYLGNATETTGSLYTDMETTAAASIRVLEVPQHYNVTVDSCVFHNCSSLYIYGGGFNTSIVDSSFADPTGNITLFTKFTHHFVMDNTVFDNASSFL